MYQAGFFWVMDCSFYYGSGVVDFLVGEGGQHFC